MKKALRKTVKFMIRITDADLKAIEQETKKRGEWSRAKVALDLIREAIRHSTEAK